VIRQVESLKAASDGLFLELVRNAGPQFIQLLQQVSKILVQLTPVVTIFGKILGETFLVASAAAKTLADNIGKILISLAVPIPGSTILLLGSLSGEFAENLANARNEVEQIRNTLPQATFNTKDAKANEDSLRNAIALLKVNEQAAQRTYNEEIAAAKRAYEARGITAEQFYQRELASEQKLLAAKLATIKAEAEAVKNSNSTRAEKQIELAQLNERELQLLSDFREKSIELKNDQLKAESDAINRTLDNTRKVAQERLRLRQELLQVQLETRAIILDTARINLERDAAVPGNETAELERRKRLAEEEARLQSARTQAQIQARIDELQFADLTYAERLEKERTFNQQLIAERQRLGNELAQIAINARTEELQGQGFDQGQAAAIAEQEALLERQTTASEKFRISIRATALELSKSIPSAAALAAQSFRVLGSAMAQSIGAFVSGQASFRQALGQMVKAVFDSLAQVALAKGAEQFAWALSDLAVGNFAGAAKHFAAGAAWSALGGLVSGVGNAIAGGGGAAQGGLSQQLTGTTQPTSIEERTRFRDGSGLNRAETQVVITLKTDQQQIVQNVEYGVRESFRNDGAVRRVIQNETQGTPIDN
jgi:hypothetical protein